MAVFSIWESRFPPEHAERGRAVTEAIWQDMLAYPGYLRHTLVEDSTTPATCLSSASGRAARRPTGR